eukprot:5562986-Pyramimonas_sp.AAC.2
MYLAGATHHVGGAGYTGPLARIQPQLEHPAGPLASGQAADSLPLPHLPHAQEPEVVPAQGLQGAPRPRNAPSRLQKRYQPKGYKVRANQRALQT